MKGPSVTVSLPPAARTRAPCELGSSPPVSSSTPALVISSACLPMAAMSLASGGAPVSKLPLALTIIMYLIVVVPFLVDMFDRLLQRVVGRGWRISTMTATFFRPKLWVAAFLSPFLDDPPCCCGGSSSSMPGSFATCANDAASRLNSARNCRLVLAM